MQVKTLWCLGKVNESSTGERSRKQSWAQDPTSVQLRSLSTEEEDKTLAQTIAKDTR